MLCLSEPESLGQKNCLFVKLGKPKQDTRFDVHVFGLQTWLAMKEAGIKSVALEGGTVLLLDRNEVIANAKKNQVTLFGVKV